MSKSRAKKQATAQQMGGKNLKRNPSKMDNAKKSAGKKPC